MTGSDQSLPGVPPGIDPEVQAKINALLARPPIFNARHMAGGIANGNGVVLHIDARTAPPQYISDAQIDNRRLSPTSEPILYTSKPGNDVKEDNDADIWHDCALLTPPSLPPRQADTCLGDPTKVSRSNTSQCKVLSDVFPPTQAMTAPSLPPPPPPPPPPPSPTLFKRALSYIGSYFFAQPSIIEYPDAEIERKIQVCIEARKWYVPNSTISEPVFKVIAILTDISPTGANSGESELVQRRVEMVAKHKRVREIREERGCYVSEDIYAEEIRVALRRLKR